MKGVFVLVIKNNKDNINDIERERESKKNM